MSTEASPRPWTWDINDDDQLMLYDADGNPLGQLFDHGCESEATLIVDAVNERERLRDIVREALPFIEGAIDGVSTILGDAEMSKAAGECGAPPKDVMEAFVADGRRILREARAAIGEDKE